jgi:hypothetical protein
LEPMPIFLKVELGTTTPFVVSSAVWICLVQSCDIEISYVIYEHENSPAS